MEDRQDTTLQEEQQAQEQQQGGNVGDERQKRKRMQLPPAEERPEREVTLTESKKEYYRKKLEPVNAKYDGYGDQNTKDQVVDFGNSLLKALGQKTRLDVDSGNLVIKEITFRPCRQERSYTDATVLTALRGRTRSSRRRRVPVSREESGANDTENNIHEGENNAIAGSPTGANGTMGGSMDEGFEHIGHGTIPESSHNMEMMEPHQSQFESFEPTGEGSTGQESTHQQEQVEGFECIGCTMGAGSSHRLPQVEGLEPTRGTMGSESSHDREVESPVEGFQPIGGSSSDDVEVGQHNTSPGGVQLRNIRSKLDPQIIAALKGPTNTRPNKGKSHSDVRVQTMQEVGRDTDETIRQGHSSTSPLGVDMRTSMSHDFPGGNSRGMDRGGENPESPNTRLSRLENTLREKEMLLKELIQDVLMDTDSNSIYGRQLLESLVFQFVLLEFPTPSCPLSVSELVKKVVCGIKTSFGVGQTKLSHIDFDEEVSSILATFDVENNNGRIYLLSDEAAPNAEALRQVEKLRLEINALKRERDSIQAEQGQIPKQ